MTTPREMSWQDAVAEVVQSAKEPIHYKEITRLIGERGLRPLTGAIPANNVRAALFALENDERVARTGRGLFAVPAVAQLDDEQAKAAESEAERAAEEFERLTVKAFGLHWRRDLVDWSPTTGGRILGWQGVGESTRVDFADQDGIYFLHSGNEVAYVGKTRTPSSRSGLYNRLRAHNVSPRRSDRWDAFSWFGFRPVDPESGQLMETPQSATIGDVINLIEAIFIEGLMPRLNMQRGQNTNDWLETCLYSQVEDPKLIADRLAALTTIGAALR